MTAIAIKGFSPLRRRQRNFASRRRQGESWTREFVGDGRDRRVIAICADGFPASVHCC